MLKSLFNNVAILQASNSIIKKLQQRFFLVKFAKFLRTPFLKNLREGLLFKRERFRKLHLNRPTQSTKFIQWILTINKELFVKTLFENKPLQKSSLPSKSWLVWCLYHLPRSEKGNSVSITKTKLFGNSYTIALTRFSFWKKKLRCFWKMPPIVTFSCHINLTCVKSKHLSNWIFASTKHSDWTFVNKKHFHNASC